MSVYGDLALMYIYIPGVSESLCRINEKTLKFRCLKMAAFHCCVSLRALIMNGKVYILQTYSHEKAD